MNTRLIARLIGRTSVGASLLLALLGSSRAGEPVERPANIVLLYADDWRHDTLGCAGNTTVQTPHLDRLAAAGLRFTDARVTTAICGVSRASLLTGQWMSRHGNRGFDAFSTPWDETLPGLLRANGYWTGHVGKWHCGRFPDERFDFGKAYSGVHWIRRSDGSEVHVTAQNEADALEFLRTRPAERPFFLTVAFFAPHAEDGHAEQYRPQPHSAQWYEGVTIPVPPTATPAHTAQLPPFLADPRNEGRRRWSLRFDTPEKYQRMMTSYFRLCSEVDAACGAVLAELERLGLADDTLVVFTSDNGYFHGEKGLADKWYPYEESIRVPLIVRDPRAPEALEGSTSAAFALNVDLAPTLLAAAGVEPPRTMQGRDLTPWLRQAAVADWRTEYFYEHPVIRSVDFIPSSEALVTRALKYIRWPDHTTPGHLTTDQVFEELFDLATDPREERDLSADPARGALLADLRLRLAAASAAVR
jgi:arylsulfatase